MMITDVCFVLRKYESSHPGLLESFTMNLNITAETTAFNLMSFATKIAVMRK